MSKFEEDIAKEILLGKHLDTIYRELKFKFSRITNKKQQREGIDIILEYGDKKYNVDEKAQLHYINKNLYTFTFELSYCKHGKVKKGWLFDEEKRTDYYFLITKIHSSSNTIQQQSDITSCTITSVHREKLICHLSYLGLDKEQLSSYDETLRYNNEYGRHEIGELKATEGVLFFTEHLTEKPINLQLKLSYLKNHKLAKQIYPTP